ncbi:histidine phosphatase family protein [Shigella flexneri]
MLHQVPFDRVLCSELERTLRTARLLLGERRIPITPHPLLNEMFSATGRCAITRDLQIEDEEKLRRLVHRLAARRPTNGEGFPDFSAAFSAFAAELARYDDHNLLPNGQQSRRA